MLPLVFFPARRTILNCENRLLEVPVARRLLVIRLGAVGDVVRTLPAVTSLREAYPNSELSWLVEPPAADLLRGQPWIDHVLVFPRPVLRDALVHARLLSGVQEIRHFLRELRAPQFDLVVDFHSILKSGVLSWLSGSSRRVAYARPYGRECTYWFATDRARFGSLKASRFERNQALVRFLGVTESPRARPLEVPSGLGGSLSGPSIQSERMIAINPGTSSAMAYKRYTVQGYVEVIQRLSEDGYRCMVTWGSARGERQFAEAIVRAAEGRAQLAPSTATLLALAAFLRRCCLYVGSDTGPMHIASLVGTPVLQLLGPTDPVENEPYPLTPSRRVRVQIGCNPCRRGCDTALCMRVIPPEKVVKAARELLASGSAGC